jgi:hypothetical protein
VNARGRHRMTSCRADRMDRLGIAALERNLRPPWRSNVPSMRTTRAPRAPERGGPVRQGSADSASEGTTSRD